MRFLKTFIAYTLAFAMTLCLFPAAKAETTSTYYDLNFDSNVEVSGMSWGVSSTSIANVQDVAKTNKSMKITMDSTHGTGFARLDYSAAGTYADLSGKVLWMEVSFMYEDAFTAFGPMNYALSPFMVNASGELVQLGWNWSGGTKLAQLELDKWYHVVASLDFTNESESATTGAELKVWLNGELVGEGVRNSNFKTTGTWTYTRWRLDKPSSDSANTYIDNLKCYATDVMDTHAVDDFADTVITDANDSDSITIADGAISVPEGTTVSELTAGITATGTKTVISGGAVVTASEVADGSILCVNASNGIATKQYSVTVSSGGGSNDGNDEIENVFLDKAVTSSTHINHPSGPFSNMVDGDLTTRQYLYSSDKAGENIVYQIALGAIYSLDTLKIYDWYEAGEIRSDETTVEVSTDGGTWTTLIDKQPLAGTTAAPSPNLTTFALNNAQAAYVRLSFHNTNGTNHPSFFDIQCNGTYVSEAPLIHYNLNFDNDASLGSLAWASGVSPTSSAHAQDVAKANKSLKITMSSSHSAGFARMDATAPADTYADVNVLWLETSFMYEDAFSAFGPEFGSGVHPFMVDANGKLRQLAWNWSGGTELVQLEVGKWYHVVASIDFTDAEASTESGAELKIWLNGELVGTGTRNSNLKPSSSWSYYRWRLDKPTNSSADFWLDNFTSYETSVVDTHAVTDFGAATITDADDTDEVTITDKTINAPSGATIGDVSEGIYSDGKLVFVKNGVVKTGNVYAWGTILYVNAANGIGLEKYVVSVAGEEPESDGPEGGENEGGDQQEPNTPPDGTNDEKRDTITKWIWDVDFDQASDAASSSSWTNISEGCVSTLEQTHDGATTEKTLPLDTIRNSKALKLKPVTASSSSNFIRLGTENTISSLSGVLWLEISVKLDTEFTPFQIDTAGINASGQTVPNGTLLEVTSGGEIKVIGASQGYAEFDTWYHVVVALDTTSGGCMASAWLNGKNIRTNEGFGGFSSMQIKNIRMMVYPSSSNAGSLWVDNWKMYTTSTPLASSVYDGSASFMGADLASEFLAINNGVITAPSSYTLGDVCDRMSVSENGVLVIDNGTTLTDADLLKTTVANTQILYARSSDGVGVKKYILNVGDALLTLEGTPVWNLTDNKMKVSLQLSNSATSDQSGTLVLVAYASDGSLVKYCQKEVTVEGEQANATIESALLDLTGKSYSSVVAYLWKDMTNFFPLITPIIA